MQYGAWSPRSFLNKKPNSETGWFTEPNRSSLNMAAFKACSALVTGANRGLGLEMVKQLLEACCSNIFAACRDPDGPNSEVSIQELLKTAQENCILSLTFSF